MPAAKPTFVVAELSSPLKIVLQLFSSEEGERRLSLAHIAAFLSHLLFRLLTLKATLKHGGEHENYRVYVVAAAGPPPLTLFGISSIQESVTYISFCVTHS